MGRASRLTGRFFTLAVVVLLASAVVIAATRGIVVNAKGADGATKQLQLYSGYHALVVGCGDYHAGWPRLPNPAQDAREVAALLKAFGWTVNLLEEPDSLTLRRAMNSLVAGPGRKKDLAILFWFSGHGHTLEEADGTKLGYLVPVDAPDPQKDLIGFMGRAISMRQVETVSKQIYSKHVIMAFDSCFSGAIFQMVRSKPSPYIQEKVAYPVRQFITSGTESEQVPDRSVFKDVFVQGIRDRFADLNQDGYVTGEELGYYLQEKVIDYSKKSQHPQFGKINNPKLDKGDFVFALQTAAPLPPAAVAKPSLPPETGSIPDYETLIQKRREAKEQWQIWQEKMAAAYKKAVTYEKSAELLPAEKTQVWSLFLAAYGTDNPYSSEDEKLRAAARQKETHWTGIRQEKTKTAKSGGWHPQKPAASSEPQMTASIPKKMEQAPITLRKSGKQVLWDDDISRMLTVNGFFDNKLNPLAAFENRLVDNQNGTITDFKTGLMWVKAGSGSTMRFGPATVHVKKLNKKRFAGHSDWRIPTIEELASLLNRKKTNDRHVDPLFSTRQKRCWSADISEYGKADNRLEAWLVDFSKGQITRGRWTEKRQVISGGWERGFNQDNYVRAVRSLP